MCLLGFFNQIDNEAYNKQYCFDHTGEELLKRKKKV